MNPKDQSAPIRCQLRSKQRLRGWWTAIIAPFIRPAPSSPAAGTMWQSPRRDPRIPPVMGRHAGAAFGTFFERKSVMDRRPLLIGFLALSTLGVGHAAIAASEKAPATAADNQDARETKLVMLKLPAMV